MRLIKQVFSLLLARWVVIAGSFITGILVARVIGPEGKGIIAVIGSVAGLLSVLAGFGLPSAITYFYTQKKYGLDELIGTAVVFWGFILSLLFLLLIWQTEAFLDLFLGNETDALTEPLWFWLGLATVPGLVLTSLLGSILVVDDRAKLYTGWNISSQFVGIVLTLVFVVIYGWGIAGFLIVNVVVNIFPVVVLGYWLVRLSKVRRLRVSWHMLRQMLDNGLQQHSITIVATMFKRGEVLVLALLLTPRSLGYYAVAMALYELIIDIPRAMLWPMVERFIHTSFDMRSRVAQSSRLQVLLIVPVVVGAALVGPVLIPFAYGQAFSSSVLPLICLLPGVILRTLHLSVFAYFIAIGKPGVLLPGVVIAAMVSLGLDFVLVPWIGLVGAAASTVFAELAMACYSVAMLLQESRNRLVNIVLPTPADVRQLLAVLRAFIARYKPDRTVP